MGYEMGDFAMRDRFFTLCPMPNDSAAKLGTRLRD